MTKKAGHFDAIMQALELVSRYPHIDIKVCTPVTRKNLQDVPDIAMLVDRWARRVKNRVFYNVFQTFPRAMKVVNWKDWVVSDRQFRALRRQVRGARARVKVNFLSRRTLDQLYVMIFPDGSLVIPSGPAYVAYGPFLEVTDLGAVLRRSKFDAAKHWRHARGWQPVQSAAAGGDV